MLMRSLPVNQCMRIRALQAGGVLLAALALVVHPAIGNEAHEVIEMAGVGLVLACVAGRMWSILYIGARKNRDLVTAGPYSMMRNPLYFFSTVGAAGVGLMLGSFVMAGALGLGACLALGLTARGEAGYLRARYGAAYDDYARVTPMFWPKPSLYREPAEASFSPLALKRTFLDGLFFLLLFPAIELIEHAQKAGQLPVLLNLP
ncbi:MAG: isoprenylcysteine carboxylmethyltransferase family protein [Aquamicrobium sp.]|uniref:methyltransferase family protein n=1 Tax=Aquamicrobium sp. TaxID=1872579 RepID=UPI00349E6463|nr:isoprenylcysteine carboxylmethyltransferase family protein [Aquamicrobium sp.]